MLPKIGFKVYGALEVYARVIRPWKQFASRPKSVVWRDAARLGRNVLWSLETLPAREEGWSAVPATAAEIAGAAFESRRPKSFCAGRRSAELLEYLLECPIARCSLFAMSRNGAPCGYFLLNKVGGQCRIIDLSVNSDDECDWRPAYRLALRTAAAARDVCEVSAVASLPWVAAILRESGFRLRDTWPVLLFDPQRVLEKRPTIVLQMVDCDAFYLHDEAFPYLT